MSALDITAEDDVEVTEVEQDPAVKTRRRRGRQKDKPDEGVSVPDFTLEDVSAFATERQLIWHRRFREERPEPWTEDAVLRHWRICNIARELDAGTEQATEIINIARSQGESDESIVMNAVVYRLLNRKDSWTRHVGWLYLENSTWSAEIDAAFDRLQAASDEGEIVGTTAWRATSLATVRRSCQLVAAGLSELTLICQHANQLSTVHALLARAYEIGDFTAYQVALDLKMAFPNLDNTEWAFIYGRARNTQSSGGSMWAFKQLALEGEEPMDTAKRLRDTQRDWLPPTFFEVLPEFLEARIRLEDVDNIMCEFRKYWLKKHGSGVLRHFGSGPDPDFRKRKRTGGGRGSRRSESTNWSTPPALYAQLDEEFHFTVDAAAADDNHVHDTFWTLADDALAQDWEDETVYAMPPFGELRDWTSKACDEVAANTNTQVVMVLPAHLETRWWHENVAAGASEIRLLRGMVEFYEDGGPRGRVFQSPIAIVVWDKREQVAQTTWGISYPDRGVVEKSGWTGGL
jgi:phage N-6-adenine-methyltransferase